MNPPTIKQQVTFLHTPDLAQTAAFYGDLLGLPMILDQGACQIFQVGRDAFLGFCTHLSEGGRPDGIMLTLVTDEVDAWHAYLKGENVPIEKPPTLNAHFNIYQCFVRDPNGYLVEIQQFLDPAWPRA